MEELGIAAPDDGTCPGGPCVPGQTDSAEFSAEVQFRLTVSGRPVAAGHEAQTRTVGFHGYVASPAGCSGPAPHPVLSAARSGVVEIMFFALQIHNQIDNVSRSPKEKRVDPVHFMQLIYTPFPSLSRKNQPKK